MPTDQPPLFKSLHLEGITCLVRRSSTCRLIPAFVALTTGAAAYYLGRSSGDSRLAGKKNKKVRGRKVEWILEHSVL